MYKIEIDQKQFQYLEEDRILSTNIYLIANDKYPLYYCDIIDNPKGEKEMGIKLINIGFGNIVSANRLVAIVSPESAPIKRIIQEARDRGMLIDATYGRRTRSVIITDSDHIILSAVQTETLANRLDDTSSSLADVEVEDDYDE